MDLDTILSELLEIENQLSSDAGDQFLLGLPPLPRSSAANNKDEIERLAPLTSSPSRTFSTSNIGGGEKASSSVPSSFSASSKQLSMVQPPIAQQQHQINNCCLLEGQRKRTPLHVSFFQHTKVDSESSSSINILNSKYPESSFINKSGF